MKLFLFLFFGRMFSERITADHTDLLIIIILAGAKSNVPNFFLVFFMEFLGCFKWSKQCKIIGFFCTQCTLLKLPFKFSSVHTHRYTMAQSSD